MDPSQDPRQDRSHAWQGGRELRPLLLHVRAIDALGPLLVALHARGSYTAGMGFKRASCQHGSLHFPSFTQRMRVLLLLHCESQGEYDNSKLDCFHFSGLGIKERVEEEGMKGLLTPPEP